MTGAAQYTSQRATGGGLTVTSVRNIIVSRLYKNKVKIIVQ